MKKPLNFAVLKYMTTVEIACVDDVMEALKDEYADWKMFKPAGILEVLMTGEKNGLLVEDHYAYNDKGELMIYYRAHEEGREIINSYIK
jgi:DNA-binding PadR family transcriptional regulator